MRRSSSEGGAERRNSLPRSTPRLTAGRSLNVRAPASDIWKIIERLAQRLGNQHPRPRRHIGDRVIVEDKFAPVEPAFEHAEAAIVFVGIALVRIGVLALRVVDKMAELPGHRPEIADLPEQPFESFLTPAPGLRHKPSRLFGQMDQDRARFENRHRPSGSSWSTIAGMRLFGLIARNSGLNWSPLPILIGITRYTAARILRA